MSRSDEPSPRPFQGVTTWHDPRSSRGQAVDASEAGQAPSKSAGGADVSAPLGATGEGSAGQEPQGAIRPGVPRFLLRFTAVTAARLRVRKRVRQGQHVFAFDGEKNGSTACQAPERLAGAPPRARDLVLDLSGVTIVDPFGLEVLSRGLRDLGRGRRVRIQAPPQLLPVLASLTGGLVGA